MKISTILDHIDIGHIALPEFQRGYVWNRNQVRELFDSLYRRHPVGGLLVWETESSGAEHRGEGQLAAGFVKLLLDGQQRITSLYGVTRGRPPAFFDGNAQAFEGLYLGLIRKTFQSTNPDGSITMKKTILFVLAIFVTIPAIAQEYAPFGYDGPSCDAQRVQITEALDRAWEEGTDPDISFLFSRHQEQCLMVPPPEPIILEHFTPEYTPIYSIP